MTNNNIPNKGELVIYQSADGSIQLDVKMEKDTIWLSQQQMAKLFEKDRTVIGRHIRNIFNEGELDESSVCAKFAHAKDYGRREGFTQQVEIVYYNLDVIISVGYRVKSLRGTQFRIWANKVLKDYLIKGYAINEQRIKTVESRYADLKDVVRLIGRTLSIQEQIAEDEERKDGLSEEKGGLLSIITDYVYALDTLDRYDYQQLTMESTTKQEQFHATYENAMEAIQSLKDKFGGSALFANEKDDSFKSSIGQIYQSFGGTELYPSVEEKAAMLLYLVVKNHSFSDGNKRIAAMLFLWFLSNNGILYATDGSKRIGNNTLVALTLMIAESKTEEMEVIVKVVVNLINGNN